MYTTDQAVKVFIDKLTKTGSFDEAIGKVVWIAFNEGLLEGAQSDNKDNLVAMTREILRKGYGE